MLSLRLPLWSTLVSKIFKNKSYRTAEVSINRRHILAPIHWAHFWPSRANARSEKILESPPKVNFGPPWSSGNATSSTSNQANLVSAYSISLPQSTSDTFGQIQDFHKFTQVRVQHIVVHFAMISRMMTKLYDKFGQPWQVKTRASHLFWCQWKYLWLQYICPIRHQQQKDPPLCSPQFPTCTEKLGNPSRIGAVCYEYRAKNKRHSTIALSWENTQPFHLQTLRSSGSSAVTNQTKRWFCN